MTLKSHNLKMLYCESSMQKWNFALFMGKKFNGSTGAEWGDCFHFGVKTFQSQTVLPSCWKCNGYLRWLLVVCEQTQICLPSSRASALWKGACAGDPTVCLPFFFFGYYQNTKFWITTGSSQTPQNMFVDVQKSIHALQLETGSTQTPTCEMGMTLSLIFLRNKYVNTGKASKVHDTQ